MVVAAGGFLFLVSRRTPATLPAVRIEDPRTGDELIAGNPAVVYAHADDPDGIAGAELWINGQLVAAEVNAGGENPFIISERWMPKDVGAYLVLVRATDTKGYVGQSASTLVNVGQQPPLSPDAVSAVPASEAGGQAALIPVPTDEPPVAGGAPSDGGAEPAVGIPAPPPGPPGGAPPVDPVLPPFYRGVGYVCVMVPSFCGSASGAPAAPPSPADPATATIPDWGIELCSIVPDLPGCLGAPAAGRLPPNAPLAQAIYEGGCRIGVFWSDESTDEIGFKVYRVTGIANSDVIAFSTHAGGFTDTPGMGGAYRYFVSAYNAAGEFASAPTDEITVPPGDCLSPAAGSPTELELEALSFSATEGMDKVYCYYKVADAPYARVPSDYAEFMELNAGAWDIADYAGGNNRLAISLPPDRSLTIKGECLGWSGPELFELGSFVRTHSPEEWDGRTLSASPASGSFTVTYRVQPPPIRPPEDIPRFEEDPSVPMPYNLALTGACVAVSGGDCPPDSLHWRWLPRPVDPRPLVGFKVFLVIPGPGPFPLQIPSYSTRGYWAPLENNIDCVVNFSRTAEGARLAPRPEDLVVARQITYQVVAEVLDPSTGMTYESLPSSITVAGDCPASVLAITLDSVGYDPNYASESAAVTGEGCNPVDAFGSIEISNGDGAYLTRVNWNCPNCGQPDDFRSLAPYLDGAAPAHDTQVGCVDRPPEGSATWQAEVPLASETLSQTAALHSPTGFAHDNNVVLVPLSTPTEPVRIDWTFYNARPGLGVSQPKWCSMLPFPSGRNFVPLPVRLGTAWKDWVDSTGGAVSLAGQGVTDNVCWLNISFDVLGTQ